MSNLPAPTTAQRHRHRILVVDDEPYILTSLRDLLEDEFDVLTSQEPAAALEIIAREELAVIVTDQRMPGFQGDELLSRAAEVSRATRVLITGYSDLEAVIRAVNRGHVYAYVAKPWEPWELRVTLARAAEHYQLVRDLHHERELLRQLMENTPDLIYFKDTQGRYTRLNPATARLLGLDVPEDGLGRHDREFFPEQAERIEQEDRRILSGGSAIVDRIELYNPPDGSVHWFSTTKGPLLGERGQITGLFGTSRDITERKRTAEELGAALQRAARAQADQKRFTREVLRAVTRGRFRLVDEDEIPGPGAVQCEATLDNPAQFAALRAQLSQVALRHGLSDEQAADLVLAAGEAATNAVKHARGGRWRVGLNGQAVRVHVWDRGPGILPEHLPASILQPGFSTRVSLGMGYTLMLGLVDTIWLATGPHGTQVILEKRQHSEEDDEARLQALLDRFGE